MTECTEKQEGQFNGSYCWKSLHSNTEYWVSVPSCCHRISIRHRNEHITLGWPNNVGGNVYATVLMVVIVLCINFKRNGLRETCSISNRGGGGANNKLSFPASDTPTSRPKTPKRRTKDHLYPVNPFARRRHNNACNVMSSATYTIYIYRWNIVTAKMSMHVYVVYYISIPDGVHLLHKLKLCNTCLFKIGHVHSLWNICVSTSV